MFRSILAVAACLAAVPAAGRTFAYDCDTMSNRFSEISTPLAGGRQISGVVTATRTVTGERYETTSRVAIEGDEAKSWVGFRLTIAGPADSDTLIATMVVSQDGKEEEIALGPVKLMQPVPFRLSLGRDGSASLELADWKHKTATGLKSPATLSVGCSTGEFKFASLDFG